MTTAKRTAGGENIGDSTKVGAAVDLSGARYGRHLAIVLAALTGILALVAGFNIAIDPFLYRWPRSASAPEPAFALFDREAHYNLVALSRPHAILLGNSQVQHGLVPSHWRADGPVINSAAVGAPLPEIREMLVLAQHNASVHQAIIGMDFGMTHRLASPPPPANQMYLLSPEGRPRLEQLKGLVSFPMLRASATELRSWLRHQRAYGLQGEALDSVYKSTLRQHGGAWASMLGRLGQFRQNLAQPPAPFLAQLRALRDTACRGGTRLQVFLTPNHAIWLQTIRQEGLEGEWMQWKRDLVAIASERADCGFEVWDFNTYNRITTEPLPSASGALRYSWDGVHFRTTTGDLILARMEGAAPDDDGPSAFGVRLTPANLEARLAVDRQAGAEFQRQNPQLLTSLASLAARQPPAQP